jgi:hypothetical protein
MCAYVTDDKYILENDRIRESGHELYVRDISDFISKCSKYPLYNALNPTMMIICNQLIMFMESRAMQEEEFDNKLFFREYLPSIKSIFGGRNVNDEKLLQDIIVYFNHLSIINGENDTGMSDNDQEYASGEEYDDNDAGVYDTDVDEDDGDEYNTEYF